MPVDLVLWQARRAEAKEPLADIDIAGGHGSRVSSMRRRAVSSDRRRISLWPEPLAGDFIGGRTIGAQSRCSHAGRVTQTLT
jgi:hypothetical protein